MIVGNGEVADTAAAMIDAADLVVRFNDCRSAGRGGSRTDVVAVCNTGRPAKAMLASPAWRDSEPVQRAGAIWCVRDPRKFATMRGPLAVSYPALDDFCDDYTDQFAAFAQQTGKSHRVIDGDVHSAVDAALIAVGAGPYVVPSSGLVVIAALIGAGSDDVIRIAGFGHVGWEGHPFAAERLLVDSYAADGLLQRLESGIAVQNAMPYISGRG
ncbi:MAG: Urease operon accessory protein [Allorhizobium sp.]